MNFDDVLNKKIKPVFVPEVKSPEVPQNFDREFTDERAADSLVMPVFGSLAQVSGFSYVDSLWWSRVKSDNEEDNKQEDGPLMLTQLDNDE